MKPSLVAEITADDRGALLDALADLTARRRGWVNVQPVATDELPAQRSGLFGVLGPRLPDLALGTWTAPSGRAEDEPSLVGVQHPVATRALPTLAAAGLDRPEGWSTVQDAVRRGLVLKVPAGTAVADIAGWLLSATVLLTPRETSGRWTVTVHEGR